MQAFSKITTQTSLKLLLTYSLATKEGKPGETTYFAGFMEYTPTFDNSGFKKIHKELPFTVFCSIDFDVCP